MDISGDDVSILSQAAVNSDLEMTKLQLRQQQTSHEKVSSLLYVVLYREAETELESTDVLFIAVILAENEIVESLPFALWSFGFTKVGFDRMSRPIYCHGPIYCHSPIYCHNSIYGMTFKPFRALCLEGASCCCLDLYATMTYKLLQNKKSCGECV